MASPTKDVLSQNVLLSSLPVADQKRMGEEFSVLVCRRGDPLFEADESAEVVYFPTSGVASMIRVLASGTMIEVGVVGFEGVVGIEGLTAGAHYQNRAIMQVAGSVLRFPARRLRDEFHSKANVQDLLLRYINSFMAQVSLTAACNRAHHIEQRLARWLLMVLDRSRRTPTKSA